MNASMLQSASSLAKRFGVKSLVYGGPGSGKTPLVKTAPRPVLCVVEPGMLSMRDADKVPAWDAYSAERIDEFLKWLFESKEANNFDTVCIDSVSQMAEIYLTKELNRNKDGRKAYGELSRTMMDILNKLYYLPNKNIYLIGKQTTSEEGGINKRKPYFPGQDLNVKVPHLFDEILHIGLNNIPGQPKPIMAIRSQETFDIVARDRSGKLAELEPPDLTYIFNKIMG